MCGIAGFIARGGSPVDRDALVAMVNAVQHRGPDDEGVMVDGAVGFGHRRLAIVDLTADGHQPMSDAHGDCTLVYNGEIYNYVELREELRSLGNVITTATDSEVLLAAYRQWGESCVERFNGMWAFALFDRTRRRVFCSRDRFGVKPFYFIDAENAFLFASEIRQLLPYLRCRQANREVLLDFLVTSTSDHRQETFFDNVLKLPAGHNLIYDLERESTKLHRYYRLQVDPSLAEIGSGEAVALFGERFADAVSIRLRADVAVGTCLSGGLDSSSVATLAGPAYLAKRHEPFRAITAISEQAENDESFHAQRVARHAGLDWLTVRPDYEAFVAALPGVVTAQEEPFMSPSICMQYFVMRTARANAIPVLLDGQGGDETLLGYERYFAAHFVDVARRHGFVMALRAAWDSGRNNALMSPFKMLQYLVYFSSSRVRYANYRQRHTYLRDFPAMPAHISDYAHASRDVQALQILDIECANLPALLRYEDKNSMWHSIETRLPFLDYRLLELSLSLPGITKICGGWTKFVLRKAMEGMMPDEITWRRDKKGFEAPEALWLRRHRDAMRRAVLGSDILASVCRPAALERDFDGLDLRSRWRLFSVALWEKEFGVTM